MAGFLAGHCLSQMVNRVVSGALTSPSLRGADEAPGRSDLEGRLYPSGESRLARDTPDR